MPRGEQIGEADPAYDELTLLPPALKGAKVIHRVSRQLIRGATKNVLDALGAGLVTRFALLYDAAFLVGDGAADTPLGFVNQPGVQNVATVGIPDIDTLHDTVQLAMAANADPSAWFLNPREWTTFRKAKTNDGHYLLQPDPTEAARWTLLGIPAYPTTQLPTDGGVGNDEAKILLVDMRQAVVAVDEDVDVTILTERYADYDQIGIRVTARMDFGLTNPEGVVVLDGALSA